MAIKVVITKVLPLGGASGVQSTETKIVFAQTNSIYDAFVQANRDEVAKLTQEVREAHEHIHQDKADVLQYRDDVEQDRQEVEANKADVNAARDQVIQDRDQVRGDRDVVREDRNTVANDKAIVLSKRIEVGELAEQVAADKRTTIEQAGIATTQAGISTVEADRAKSEADRAKELADGINVSGGSVQGDLHVTGTITEGGQALSVKYASPAFVLAQVEELKGGASGAYDTLKEIEEALKANDGDIGTITTALGLKADKAAPVFSEQIQLRSGDNAARVVVSGNMVHYQGGSTLATDPVHEMALSGWFGKPLHSLQFMMQDGVIPIIRDSKGRHKIYNEAFKPTWSDIGGNDVISVEADGRYKVGNGKWLRAAGESVGFLPDQASETGRGFIGTSTSWFKASYVANTFTKALNLGDEIANFTIQKQGEDLVFLV